MKPPENTQQTIAYMSACQTWFAEVTEINVGSQENAIRVVEKEAVAERNNVFHMQNHMMICGDNDTSCCYMCGANLNIKNMSIVVTNPFSDIKVLGCKKCSRVQN